MHTQTHILCKAHTHNSRSTQIPGVGHLVVDQKKVSRRKRKGEAHRQTGGRKAFNEEKKRMKRKWRRGKKK